MPRIQNVLLKTFIIKFETGVKLYGGWSQGTTERYGWKTAAYGELQTSGFHITSGRLCPLHFPWLVSSFSFCLIYSVFEIVSFIYRALYISCPLDIVPFRHNLVFFL